MILSEPFIRRPIGTFLLAAGLFLAGALAYFHLPVSSLPNIDLPTIRVAASQPGADPETMAATVAAPLERRIGTIAGVTELTSWSTLGSSNIIVQFDLSRNVDDAARDVQAAINGALADLPATLSRRPTIRKVNPAATPIMILAMTSATRRQSEIYDTADLVVSTRISQVPGVAEVSVSGAEQPAVRIAMNPAALKARGIGIEDVRTAITSANALAPLGAFDAGDQTITIGLNSQLSSPEDYGNIVVKAAANGAVVRLKDVADVRQATRNRLNAGSFNGRPAVLLNIQKTADANVVETVRAVREMLPEVRSLVPADMNIDVVSDRTATIRRSVEDLQVTLALSVLLVMAVVYAFMRRGVPTLAAGITVPLSLAGTVSLMWLFGFGLDNITLLALTISVGFVVDDAIVMIENCYRNMEAGLRPFEAALKGAREIGFTVVSISLSLCAAFIPILFMGGIMGRILRQFGVTLTFAIAVSAVVSLTVTPMICGRFIRRLPRPRETLLDRLVEPALEAITRAYDRSLGWAFRHRWLMLAATLGSLALTVHLYSAVPKSFVPQGDTGLLIGFARASPDTSFDTMVEIQQRVVDALRQDPAIAGVSATVGGGFGSNNQVRFFVSLKPAGERDSAFQVVTRLRQLFQPLVGVQVSFFPAQEVAIGGRQGRSQFQVTLWSTELPELVTWVPKAVEALKQVPGIVDVNTDREAGGPEAYLRIDRVRAARLGVTVRQISQVLNDSFSQRQVTTVYTDRNQYNVVLEVDPRLQRDMTGLERIFVESSSGQQIPLSAVVTFETASAPLVVNHQGQFPSITISFNLAEGEALGEATQRIEETLYGLHMPDSIRIQFAGDAAQLSGQGASQPLLIVAAILTVYIVLGVLYENLVHPLTILSTLPSAGLGALVALQLTGTSLSIIALIGIILLIGIVKKNGIMLVDFAIEAQRKGGMDPDTAIRRACVERFRPITMTTLAALLGAVPLVLASGPGSELRLPLGITIIGGLIVSQFLTIYTTPIIYLMLENLRPATRRARKARAAAAPAE